MRRIKRLSMKKRVACALAIFAVLALATTALWPRRVKAATTLDPQNPGAGFQKEGNENHTPGAVLTLTDTSIGDFVAFFAFDAEAAAGTEIDVVTTFQIRSTTPNNADAGNRVVINDGVTRSAIAACITKNGVRGIGLLSQGSASDPNSYPVFVPIDWTAPVTLRLRRHANGDAEIMEINGVAPSPQAILPAAQCPAQTRPGPTVEFGARSLEAQCTVEYAAFRSERVECIRQPGATTLDPKNPSNFIQEGGQGFTPGNVLTLTDAAQSDFIAFYAPDTAANAGTEIDLVATFQIRGTVPINVDTGNRIVINDGATRSAIAACVVLNGVRGIGLKSQGAASDASSYPVFVPVDWQAAPVTVRLRRHANGDAEIVEINGVAPSPRAILAAAQCAGPTHPGFPSIEFGCASVDAVCTVEYSALHTEKCPTSVPPVFTVPPTNHAAFADGSCHALVPDFIAGVVVSGSSPVALSQTPTVGTSVTLGHHPVRVTATDGGGRSSFFDVFFDVTDNTPPTFSTPPTNHASFADASCQALVPDFTSGVVASDNCGSVTLTQSPAAGTSVTLGHHPVRVTATDGSGRSSFFDVFFDVTDNTPPVLTAPPDVNVGTGPGATGCGVVISNATLGTASASDNCAAVSISRSGVPSGNFFPVGMTTITYTATDGSNAKMATQKVTVVDNTPPTITAPASSFSYADINCQSAIPNVLPQTIASDACGGVTLSQSPAAGTLVGVGPRTITITAKDGSNNAGIAQTTFTVIATPSFTVSINPSTVKRGGIVTLNAAFNNCATNSQALTLKVSLTRPGSNTLMVSLPLTLRAGQRGSVSIPVPIPKSTPTGLYTLTLDWYVGGIKIGTSTAQLTVTA